MIILNYRYRLYPNAQQIEILDEWLETLRVSYNYALRELRDWISSRKCSIDRCSLKSEYIMAADYPFPGYHQQQNNLPKAKKKFPRLKSVPSQVLQTNIRRLHDGWDFFRERGFGFPRWKKYGQLKSMLFPQFKENPLSETTLKLPKLGSVKINLHRPIPEGFVVKQVRTVNKAVGWFAVITIEADLNIPNPIPHGHEIGVDVGLLSYIATSDGYTEAKPKFFKEAQRRLQVLQRRLSRKMKQTSHAPGETPGGLSSRGKNYEKARLKVAKQHNYISARRDDFQFKLAHKLCSMADTIYLEDCDFRIMAKGFLGKHTLDAAFGSFRDKLEYVAQKRDVFVGRIDHRGTSQTCPNCRSEVRKDLFERYHCCYECGYGIKTPVERDIAASQEICNRGQETYRGNREKQEIGSQVVLSGNFVLGKWHGGASSVGDDGSPHYNNFGAKATK